MNVDRQASESVIESTLLYHFIEWKICGVLTGNGLTHLEECEGCIKYRVQGGKEPRGSQDVH